MPSRRGFLAGAGIAAGVAACDGAWRDVSGMLGTAIPERFSPPDGDAIDPAHHLLNRAAFGPWPGDVDRVREMGEEAWIEEQLNPGEIDDRACDVLWRRYESLHFSAGNLPNFRKPVAQEELSRARLIRAVHSRRRLFEVMVEFWTDHLNISFEKDACAWFKTADDRDVIRAHALGKFRDLIRASALSPAMLIYLDGASNRAEGPNENYARELMELHTLGVHGGYTQQDVMEAARCLTGWRVERGRAEFEPSMHDNGAKEVLGVRIPPGGGEADVDALVDIVAAHPSTARHVSWKLCRRFVSEDPPASLVDRVAGGFGDIREAVRTILLSDEFRAARGVKFKRPLEYVVSAIRALGGRTTAGWEVRETLRRLGQSPFSYPTPDGYPEEEAPWLGGLLWRWNFASELAAGRVGSVDVSLGELERAAGGLEGVARHLLGRSPVGPERDALPLPLRDAVALLLASPGFQRC